MKRKLFAAAMFALVPVVGFGAGLLGVRLVRWFEQPVALRHGDYREVVASVGAPVVLLSTTTCPWCEKTRRLLRASGVPFRDCVVDRDEFARDLMTELGGRTVPMIVSADRLITGYDEALIRPLAALRIPAPAPGAVKCDPGADD